MENILDIHALRRTLPRVGQIVNVYISWCDKTLPGKVVFVNHEKAWYEVEYNYAGCTFKECFTNRPWNMHHAICPEKKKEPRMKQQQILGTIFCKELNKHWDNLTEASKDLGVSVPMISQTLHGHKTSISEKYTLSRGL